MSNSNNPLKTIWDDYNLSPIKSIKDLSTADYSHILTEVFAVGDFYYYILNLQDTSIHHFNDKILRIHGLTQFPTTINQIIDLIHPEDISFVIEAEKKTFAKIQTIVNSELKYFKSSYSFRMRTAEGKYELFHHQAINTKVNENGQFIESINIHTNIQQITDKNNYSIIVSGLGNNDEYYNLNVNALTNTIESIPETLTKREIEILKYIAKGLSSTLIAEKLSLSHHTVIRHRKNIIKKTGTKNSAELINKCIQWGII